MLERIIHDKLTEIAEKTYPNKTISWFKLEIHAKEMASKHGDYWPAKKLIRIFNLSRKSEYIITTAIHELSHHIDHCFYGTSGHDKRFYGIYKELLETAVKMGIIDYEEARTVADARDIRSLESYYGKIEVSYDASYDSKKDSSMFKVFNSFPIKELLKQRGYRYDDIEKSWKKEIENAASEEEMAFLKGITDTKNISVDEGNSMTIEAIYYIIVGGNSYDCKDQLKQSGYYFNGYNHKGNVWVKKIKATTLDDEQRFLRKFRNIKVKVSSK